MKSISRSPAKSHNPRVAAAPIRIDKLIFKGVVEKFKVKKGFEFIEFKIEPYEQKECIKQDVE